MRYIKQLDSVRAIAVILVLIWHWIPRTAFIQQFKPGPFGVNIFFVLSGFLITQILLQNRQKAEASNEARKTILKSFYIRRILRIFPIYYLTIFLMVLLRHPLDLHLSANEVIAGSTYTTNFYLFATKTWPLASPHFWSLAVEEQFYLFWPLLMLFIPKRYLLHCIGFFIITGLISFALLSDTEFGSLLPHTCFDSLGMGALISWIVCFKPALLPRFYTVISVTAFLSAGFIISKHAGLIPYDYNRFAHSLLGAWIITYILVNSNKKTVLIALLSHKWLVNIGKVSYGIYLYHVLYAYFAYHVWFSYVHKHLSFLKPVHQSWIFFVINFCIVYFLCRLSWKFIESPILSLKAKFNYEHKPVIAKEAAVPEKERLKDVAM